MRHKLAGIYVVVGVMRGKTNLAIRRLGVHTPTSEFRGNVAQATLSARGMFRLASPNPSRCLEFAASESTVLFLLPSLPCNFEHH